MLQHLQIDQKRVQFFVEARHRRTTLMRRKCHLKEKKEKGREIINHALLITGYEQLQYESVKDASFLLHTAQSRKATESISDSVHDISGSWYCLNTKL